MSKLLWVWECYLLREYVWLQPRQPLPCPQEPSGSRCLLWGDLPAVPCAEQQFPSPQRVTADCCPQSEVLPMHGSSQASRREQVSDCVRQQLSTAEHRWTDGGRMCCDIPLLCCRSSSLTSETGFPFQSTWRWTQLELFCFLILPWIVPASEIPICSLFLKSIPLIVFKTAQVTSMNDLCRTLGIPEGLWSSRGHIASKKIAPWAPYPNQFCRVYSLAAPCSSRCAHLHVLRFLVDMLGKCQESKRLLYQLMIYCSKASSGEEMK